MKKSNILFPVLLISILYISSSMPLFSQQTQQTCNTKTGVQAALDAGINIITLENGTYYDFQVSFPELSSNITLKAQTPGEVIITGKSKIILQGSHNTIRDFIFFNIKEHDEDYNKAISYNSDGYPLDENNNIIHFKHQSIHLKYTDSCKVSDCAFIDCGKPRFTNSVYNGGRVLMLREGGNTNNTIENCYWEGSLGSCLVITNDSISEANGILNKYNIIQNNYVNNVSEWESINGNEPFMIGYGFPPNYLGEGSNNVIQNNLFENISSDSEIISVKFSNTTVKNNTFRNSPKTIHQSPNLTLRTGHNSIVEGNFFLGTGGGITVHGNGHKIFNNYIDSEYHGFHLPGGKTTDIFYPGQNNCIIANNTIVDTQYPFMFGKGKDSIWDIIPGINQLFNNIVFVDDDELIHPYFSGADAPVLFWDRNHNSAGHLIWGKNIAKIINLGNSDGGVGLFKNIYTLVDSLIEFKSPEFEIINDLYKLKSNSGLIDEGINPSISILKDIDGQDRIDSLDIGADEYSQQIPQIPNKPLTSDEVGPEWISDYTIFSNIIYNWKKWILNDYVVGKDPAILWTVLRTTTPILQLNFGGDDGFEYKYDRGNMKYIITCEDNRPRIVTVSAQDFNENNIENVDRNLIATIENWVVETVPSCASSVLVTGNGEDVQFSNDKLLSMNLYKDNSFITQIRNGGSYLLEKDGIYSVRYALSSISPKEKESVCNIEYTIKPTNNKSQKNSSINSIDTDLYSIYPNPFSESTTIRYSLKDKSFVNIAIYDLRGNLVKTLVDGLKNTGLFSVLWQGKDDNNNTVQKGIYVCRIEFSQNVESYKIIFSE